jgi:hypothetical protein
MQEGLFIAGIVSANLIIYVLCFQVGRLWERTKWNDLIDQGVIPRPEPKQPGKIEIQ